MSFAGKFALKSVVSFSVVWLTAAGVGWSSLKGQDTQQPARAALDQVLGTVGGVNAANKTFTVKEDKTGTEYTISTENARRILKVPPGEKDLKKAQAVDASQIAVGDRLLARGHKDASAPKLDASIVIIMTAGELQQKHESELADWQKRGTRGVLGATDPATKQITMNVRGPEGQKTVTVITTPETQFTRYSPDSVKYSDAKPSGFPELKPGDQLRVLGNSNADGTQITAERVISGAFRTVAAVVVSISPDGKELRANDIQTKQPIEVKLTDDSSVRRLPPMMANVLARRLNPNFKAAGAAGNPGANPDGAARDSRPGAAEGARNGGPGGSPGTGAVGNRMNGDMSQMIERLPKIAISDLKPGDALVISGGAGEDKTHLTAINIVSGVEPLFASAPPSTGRSSALGMWNLDIGTPGEQ